MTKEKTPHLPTNRSFSTVGRWRSEQDKPGPSLVLAEASEQLLTWTGLGLARRARARSVGVQLAPWLPGKLEQASMGPTAALTFQLLKV